VEFGAGVAVVVAADVAAAATAPDGGPISTSKANEAIKNAAPVTTANLPSFWTTAQSVRRARDKVAPQVARQ
jgi:hypothetical protein